jgi:predicted phosphodiesterase
MRVAVVSDIHSNLHALDAVLDAIEADATDELWCLGDIVGYGPRPNECCALVAARARLCLAGNHDLAVRGTIDL